MDVSNVGALGDCATQDGGPAMNEASQASKGGPCPSAGCPKVVVCPGRTENWPSAAGCGSCIPGAGPCIGRGGREYGAGLSLGLRGGGMRPCPIKWPWCNSAGLMLASSCTGRPKPGNDC